MSLSMLVVDDEYMILEGMKYLLPYETYGISKVYTAESAEEALQCFKEKKIDIVLTDVSMPDMTGLEMVQQMKELSTRASYIIMSGFQEFEYARQAVALGVRDYLVKPINKEDLACLLVEAFQQKKSEKHLWEEILKGKEVVPVEDIKLFVYSEPPKCLPFIEYRINQRLLFFHFSREKNIADKGFFHERLAARCDIKETLERIERYLFYKTISSNPSETVQPVYDEWLSISEKGNHSLVFQQISKISYHLRERTPPVYLSKQLFSQLISDIHHQFPHVSKEKVEEILRFIEEVQTLDDLYEQTMHYLDDIWEIYQYSPHVADSLKIIRNEYTKELSLKEVSERLFLNTGYLGQIIKRETGETFAELLNWQRVKRAQQLLISTHKGIEEICFQVGYTNIGYFYKIFKKFCGESPKSFRKNFRKRS